MHDDRRGRRRRRSVHARWALTTDRVGAVQLVELASGRTWPIDRDRLLTWWPGA